MFGGGYGNRHNAIWRAFDQKNLNEMFSLVVNMPKEDFLQINRDKVPLLHEAAATSFDALMKLSLLPYFRDIINDDSN